MLKCLMMTLMCSLCVSLYAKNIVVDGRFESKDDDNVAFVKKQLLEEAFRNAFTKEVQTMGLDSELFWNSFSTRFDEYFKGVEDDFAVKMKMKDEQGNELENISSKKKKNYLKRLRLKKLASRKSFGNFGRIIKSYSIKKMTRSPKYPNSRYIKINVDIDKKEVHRLYLKYTATNFERKYSKLFLATDFSLKQLSWLETGVEVESDFTSVVKNHWVEKLESYLASQVQEVILVDDATMQRYKRFMSIPTSEKIKHFRGESKDIADIDFFRNTLWMDVRSHIEKVKDDEEAQKRTFSFLTEMILTDSMSKKVISQHDGKVMKMSFEYGEGKNLSSNVAGSVYQSLMGPFSKLTTEIAKKGGANKVERLVLKGNFNIRTVMALNKKLSELGITHDLSPQVVELNSQHTLIDMYYNGPRDAIMSLVSGLEGQKIVDKKHIKVISGDSDQKVLEIINM